jgi:signal transduction histidine kinase
MASLGQLTAGIAHEIKNPLNFVNNFAQLSSELIDDIAEEKDVEEKAAMMQDLKSNLDKINHHGKRADSIVQSMLQHSRGTAGEKQPTDINKLCEEFADLAYHGMRANVPSFNSAIVKNFDSSLPKVNVVQQEISRVVLNLLNNAFYAVKDKKDAKVEVSTKKIGNNVQIKVRDNGTGMPENVKQKIFEPFYTTKPTGEGTGLGLSLSFDIIKAHGGEIKVESEAGKFTEFTITLPATT